MTRAFAALVSLLVLQFPPPLAAQAWTLDLSAGYVSYDAISARVATGSVLAGIRKGPGSADWLYLYGGVPLAEAGVYWGAAGAGRRLAWPHGSVYLGGDLGLHLVGYRDSEAAAGGAGATLEALPLIGFRQGSVVVELRSGMLQHTDYYEEERFTRRVHHTGITAEIQPASMLRVRTEGRVVRAPEDVYPFAGAAAEITLGSVLVSAFGGRWLTDSIPTPAYGAGAAWRARTAWAVHGSWQQDTNHPLYWNLPRRSWTLGVSRALGGPRGGGGGPLAAREADGRIAIRVPVSEAPAPLWVLGDFSEWQPVAMTREGNFWTIRLTLAPGVYRYGFRDAEGRWVLPPSVTNRVSDGMGGESAVLIVQ